MTRIEPFLLGFVLLAACGELSRTPGVDGGSDTDGGTDSARVRCDACTDSRFDCEGGECLPNCVEELGTTCASDLQCVRRVCQPRVVPTCAERPCNADQDCVSTYCVARVAMTCDRLDDPACGVGALCDLSSGTCFTAPSCDVDGSCRPGDRGAFCHTGNVGSPGLPRLLTRQCIVGACASDAHCPPSLNCREIGAAVEGLGVCR